MRRWPAAVVSVAALAVLLVGLPAQAQSPGPAPAQVSQQAVFQALGVDSLPADYVVAIDTSGSMGPLYGEVQRALVPLLAALAPSDHLSLLNFDTTPQLDYSGDVGETGAAALSRLPGSASGQNTDLGAAIGAGLAEFERPGAASIGTIILLTDGLHAPGPGSAYPSTTGGGWPALRSRADTLSKSRNISSYAIALRAQTDAGLLQQVFPTTLVQNLPDDQLAPYFERLKTQVRLDKARTILGDDPGKAVEVTWAGADFGALELGQASIKATVSLRSTSAYVPLVIGSLSVSAAGLPVVVSGLEDSVTLKPGETRSLPVTLQSSAESGFGFGEQRRTTDGQLILAGAVTSTWSEVLGGDLQRPLMASLSTPSQAVRGSYVSGWSWLELGLLLLALVAVVALLILLRISRQPRLLGSLTASAAGQSSVQGRLSGRRAQIGSVRGTMLRIPGRGNARGRRVARRGKRKGFDLELQIRYAASAKGALKAGTCKPGSSTVIDGTTFTYQPGARA